MPENARGYRNLDWRAAEQLSGLWVAAVFGDAPSQPLTPLAWDLALEDADLLARALDRRGASLPRRSRRIVAVAGHAYHALLPLVRASRELIPLDPRHLALAIACEARAEVESLFPPRRTSSRRSLALWVTRVTRGLTRLTETVVSHEQHASQHYRWLTEMDLGILPDDALATTLSECLSICRASRLLEIEATLHMLGGYAALCALSRTARLGDAIPIAAAALVPDPLQLPTATPALSALSLAAAFSNTAPANPAGIRTSFAELLRDQGPGERSLHAPYFGERPAWSERLLEQLVRAGTARLEARLVRASRARSVLLNQALREAGPVSGWILRALFALLSRLVALRSRLHAVRSRTLGMLRTAVLDVDRRLTRLLGAEAGSVFFLRLSELLESTLRPDPSLLQRLHMRRATFQAAAALPPPPAVLGQKAWKPSLPRAVEGVGLGDERVSGPACVAGDLETALSLPPSGVLVLRSLDPGLGPVLMLASAIVTDVGGLTDEGVLLARSLGIPLVIGTRDATAQIPTGHSVTVDPFQGRVWLT